MSTALSRSFRKATLTQRIQELVDRFQYAPESESAHVADSMIESAVGFKHIPLGIAPRLLINSVWRAAPMATEEPSVIAAQNFAAGIIALHGGVRATAQPSIGIGQVILWRCPKNALHTTQNNTAGIRQRLQHAFATMRQRGGGLQTINTYWQEQHANGDQNRTLVVEFSVDTCDALGANAIIRAAEDVAPYCAQVSGGEVLMAILSNAAEYALVEAHFHLPIDALKALCANAQTTAERIVHAATVAQHNEHRAVTHNKGIMNGISALALATANDVRAVEAAAHSYAARSGRYSALSRFTIKDTTLIGAIQLPIPLAIIGGATQIQQETKTMLKISGVRSAQELREMAAGIGLQQNFAALLALVERGIRDRHMLLHARRIAYQAGARQKNIDTVATHMHAHNRYDLSFARAYLETVQSHAQK